MDQGHSGVRSKMENSYQIYCALEIRLRSLVVKRLSSEMLVWMQSSLTKWQHTSPRPSSVKISRPLSHRLFGFSASEDLPPITFRDKMRCFVSVVMFHYPSIAITEAFGPNAYLYHFEEPSPYDGPTHGLPVHGQCAVYVYNSEREAWPKSARTTAAEMVKLFTTFAYAQKPWESYSVSKKFQQFGPDGECGMVGFSDDGTRDYRYLEWLRTHFEKARGLVLSMAM